MPIISNQTITNRWISFYGSTRVNDFQYLNKTGINNIIRLNSLKNFPMDLISVLENKGFQLEKLELPHAYMIRKNRISLGATNEFLFGFYAIQGFASQLTSLLVNPSLNDRVLDMSAAPGGKTSHLSALMNNKGLIIAIDPSKTRMTALRSNLSRLGVKNVIAFQGKAQHLVPKLGLFDKILLDAPCSGSGSICKNPTKEWSKNELDIERHAKLQTELLEQAFKNLKVGGEITYSTCSIEPEEGELQIHSFLEKFKDKVSIVDLSNNEFVKSLKLNSISIDLKNTKFPADLISKWIRLLPSDYYEGFFISKIMKTGE